MIHHFVLGGSSEAPRLAGETRSTFMVWLCPIRPIELEEIVYDHSFMLIEHTGHGFDLLRETGAARCAFRGENVVIDGTAAERGHVAYVGRRVPPVAYPALRRPVI